MGSGVKQQLSHEMTAANELSSSCSWSIVFFTHDEPETHYMKKPFYIFSWLKKSRLGAYLSLRLTAYNWLRQNANKYDAVLIRYPLGDPILPLFCWRILNYFTVHHTKETGEIDPSSSILSRIHYLIEHLAGRFVISRSRGLVSLTNDINQYELTRIAPKAPPTFVLANGIQYSKDFKPHDKRTGTYKFVCICSKPYPWHGVDLILSEILKSDRTDFEVHFIGDFSSIEDPCDPRVKFLGSISPEHFEERLSCYDLGLGSFALNRNNMSEACILKTREYLHAGLPVYADYVDSGLPEDFEYFHRSHFKVDKACELANHFRAVSRVDIRESSRTHIEKSGRLRSLALWLESQVQENTQ